MGTFSYGLALSCNHFKPAEGTAGGGGPLGAQQQSDSPAQGPQVRSICS